MIQSFWYAYFERDARDRAAVGESRLAELDIELDQATVDELDELINEDTVAGRRYTDAVFAAADSEND